MSESILIMRKTESYQSTPSSSIPRRVVRPKPKADDSATHSTPRSVRFSGNGAKAFKASNRRSMSKKDGDAIAPRKTGKMGARETSFPSVHEKPPERESLKHTQQGYLNPDEIAATACITAAATTVSAAADTVFVGAEILELDDLPGHKTIGRSVTKRYRATLSEKFLESLNRQDSVRYTPQKSSPDKISPRQKIVETVSQKAKDFSSLKNVALLVKPEDDNNGRMDGSLLELQVLRRRAMQEFMTSRAQRDGEKLKADEVTATDEFETNFEYLKSEAAKDISCPTTNLFDMDDIDEEYVCSTAPINSAPVIKPMPRAVSGAEMPTGDEAAAAQYSAIERRLMTPQEDGSSDLSDFVLSPARSPQPERAVTEEPSDLLPYQLSTSLRAKIDDDADDSGYHASIESGNEDDNLSSVTDIVPVQLHKQVYPPNGRIPMVVSCCCQVWLMNTDSSAIVYRVSDASHRAGLAYGFIWRSVLPWSYGSLLTLLFDTTVWRDCLRGLTSP
ncbi:hypothetical protein POJ06DRAFT_120321 [Lipomyces tetrasporus]|uniref:Uncharacterized protein n=1 Tax=Lipomyces tetrasporus TaxID=54092 RepID=A0AAD7QRL1_9ASCO|nr:uncharacterized protein POJ06DRAFT_120321 [Lipomyces tetrasporus]KAJ8099946.1 hypothetical protein POJ06DRAFT_120321 [Lipomyces tetrasporus]